jgi:hypothetical protein
MTNYIDYTKNQNFYLELKDKINIIHLIIAG